MKTLFLFGCLVGCFIVEANVDINAEKSDEDSDILEKFVLTTEWQKVRKGQALPRGVHVRMNVNSGETEAKLLEEERSTSSRTDIIAVPLSDEVNEEQYMSKEELKSFLAHHSMSDTEYIEQDKEGLKSKYRSYEELKKELGDLNLVVKTEFELLTELVAQATDKMRPINDEILSNILTDLEYLVHQIDNAQEFVKLGGLTSIIIPALNASSPDVRANTLWLVGSAAQSNPKVQIAILNHSIIQKVLRAAALDLNEIVQARAVYALSCLSRRFPLAQAKLVEEGGLGILGRIFDSEVSSDLRIKIKVLTLINDFLLERQDARKELEELNTEGKTSAIISEEENMSHKRRVGELKEKLRQYEAINLERRLQEENWCLRIPQFLAKLQMSEANADRSQRRNDLGSVVSKSLPYRPEHDVVEKVSNTMLSLQEICMEQFQSNHDLKDILTQLLLWYEELRSREEVVQKHSIDVDCSDSNMHSDGNSKNVECDLYYSNVARTLLKILEIWKDSKSDTFVKKDEL